jgi:RHS repeat-associated protein
MRVTTVLLSSTTLPKAVVESRGFGTKQPVEVMTFYSEQRRVCGCGSQSSTSATACGSEVIAWPSRNLFVTAEAVTCAWQTEFAALPQADAESRCAAREHLCASWTTRAADHPFDSPAAADSLRAGLTTRLTTENSAQLSNAQRHYPYGEALQETGTANPSVERKFTTYMKEWETDATGGKLNYAVFRSHSARTGRFLMADPVRGNVKNPQRLNRFAYVMGNPINRTDPRGLDPDFGGGVVYAVEAPIPGVGSGYMDASHVIHPLGGFLGAAEAWHAAQDYMPWLWTTPVGCWDGSGFSDPDCVAQLLDQMPSDYPDQASYDNCVAQAQRRYLGLAGPAVLMATLGAAEIILGAATIVATNFHPIGWFAGAIAITIGLHHINAAGHQINSANAWLNREMLRCAEFNPAAKHHRGKRK